MLQQTESEVAWVGLQIAVVTTSSIGLGHVRAAGAFALKEEHINSPHKSRGAGGYGRNRVFNQAERGGGVPGKAPPRLKGQSAKRPRPTI